MIQTDFHLVFERRESEFAVFSTYDFDPIYFEHRFLRSSALSNARRILIFMDSGCYAQLALSNIQAKHLNERYLLVPVRPPRGVFHPKFGMLINSDGAEIICGSNNITQAGSTHNIELFSVIGVDAIDKDKSILQGRPVSNGLSFFQACLQYTKGSSGKMAKDWLKDIQNWFSWIDYEERSDVPQTISLVHSIQSPIWNWLIEQTRGRAPSRLLILSPFYDSDLRMLSVAIKAWPKCRFEIAAQQRRSNLPARLIKSFKSNIRLFEIENENRRLHAKLLAAFLGKQAFCLAGSANFTTAALLGGNVEACLGIRTKEEDIEALFEKGMELKAIDPEDFESGEEDEPKIRDNESKLLHLISALIDEKGHLLIHFEVRGLHFDQLTVELYRRGDPKPFRSISMPSDQNEFFLVSLDKQTQSELMDALQCYILGLKKGRIERRAPCWVIQEARLTYVPSAGKSSKNDKERDIKETGRGLISYIEDLASREGENAVITFLNNLTIQFRDECSGGISIGTRLRIKDPSLPDTKPNWFTPRNKANLEKAIFDFVDRHHSNNLKRHANRGNINGLDNFLDVFITTNKLMFLYYQRMILPQCFVVDKICTSINIFTVGYESSEEEWGGYIKNIVKNLEGNKSLIRKTFQEEYVFEHLYIALLMAQIVRSEQDQKIPPPNLLGMMAGRIEEALKMVGLAPTLARFREILREYSIIDDEEHSRWLRYFKQEPFIS